MAGAELPLFPLHMVLFPGSLHLLHIFEPRYRQLLSDCLDGNKRFGLTLLQEDRREPVPGDIGCVALIHTHRKYPDGRSNILVHGEQRLVIEQLQSPPDPYYQATVRLFQDDPVPDAGAVDELVRTVWNAVERLHATTGSDALGGIDRPADASEASFRIAGSLRSEIGFQEELMRYTSTRARLDRLHAHIRELQHAADRAAEVAARARGNGHGPDHLPDPS